jgi:DNA repair exonuclease SbcCD nuclease subunit
MKTMEKKFSFLHISDIHLGRAFSDISIYTDKMKYCEKACESALNSVVSFAKTKSVDFVLIAGDSFDDDEHDLYAKTAFINALKTLADDKIKSFVICGNHDPIKMYKEISSYFKFEGHYKDYINITGITTEGNIHTYNLDDIVKIHSISFETDTLTNPTVFLEEKSLKDNAFHIGLIHCDLGKTDSKYAPCSKQELKDLGYDYYALGHIHIPSADENIVYAGTIQGRTKKETGKHGCYYVEVDNSKITNLEFIPVDRVRFSDIEVDTQDCENKIDVFSNINSQLSDLEDENVKLHLVEVNLTGVTNAYKELKTGDLLEEFTETSDKYNQIGVYEIKNNTCSRIPDENLVSDNGIIGIIAKKFGDDFSQNVEELYSEISNQYKIFYNKLPIKKVEIHKLQEALEDDKSFILKRVENELKSLCCDIYED